MDLYRLFNVHQLFLHALLFLVLTCIHQGFSAESIQPQNNLYKTERGSQLTMTCHYQIEKDPLATKWYRINITNNERIEIARRTASKDFYPDNQTKARLKISDFTDMKSATTQLTITTVECFDNGVYICSVLDSAINEIQANVTVSIDVQPIDIPSVVIHPASGDLVQGDNITFTCNGNQGFPPKGFMWTRRLQGKGYVTEFPSTSDSSPVDSGDGCTKNGTSVLQRTLTPDDDGAMYSCDVRNTDKRTSKTISVLYPVRLSAISTDPSGPDFTSGDDVTFICAASGNPTPEQYSWIFMPQSGGKVDLKTTTRMFKRTDIEDTHAGTYKCETTNTVQAVRYSVNATLTITVSANHTGAIVGGVIGGVALCVIIGVAYILCRKKKGRICSSNNLKDDEE